MFDLASYVTFPDFSAGLNRTHSALKSGGRGRRLDNDEVAAPTARPRRQIALSWYGGRRGGVSWQLFMSFAGIPAEFAELGLNLYSGCAVGCRYCYAFGSTA